MQQNLLVKEKSIEGSEAGLFASAVARAVQRLARRRTCPGASASRSASNAEARAARGEGEGRGGDRRPSSPASATGSTCCARSIEDAPDNTTRFLVLGKIDPAPTGRDRTSLVMSAENKPGAVHALLTPLAEHRRQHDAASSRGRRAPRRRCGSTASSSTSKGHQQDAAVSRSARRRCSARRRS